jgi:hypothetical protein
MKMTVANVHGRNEQDQRAVTPWSAGFFGRPGPASLKFWLTRIAFLGLYLPLNKLTVWHAPGGLGITLWSPDNGLSLVMLIEGTTYAPFVFLGAILADAFIAGVHQSLYATVAAEVVLTLCYLAVASEI